MPAPDLEFWNIDRCRKLSAMWRVGHACSQIAETLGTTKSAVIGKARRLGLEPRESPIARTPQVPVKGLRRSGARHATDGPRPKRSRAYKGLRQEEQGNAGILKGVRPYALKIPKRFSACQFIAGEPRHEDSCKCGAPVVVGAYCVRHVRLCYGA